MFVSTLHRTLPCLLALALLPPATARAAPDSCGLGSHTVYIGNTATDSQCNYTTLAAAMTAETCPNTMFVLTSEVDYTGKNIVIADRDLSIRAYPVGLHCGPQVDPGGTPAQIKLDVTGTTLPAVAISGTSNVTISGLEITGGTGPTDRIAGAGGVNFSGTGSLRLNSVNIHHNSGGQGGVTLYGSGTLTLDGATISNNTGSSDGGGVSVYATAPTSMLIVDDASAETVISNNSAVSSGGGISLQGPVHLTAVATAPQHIDIGHNSAEEGAGVDIGAQASADIGLATPDPAGGTMLGSPSGIHDNTATYDGGGISVHSGSNGNGALHLFNTSAAGPTVLFQNSAAHYGGGLEVADGALACVYGVAMYYNNSPTGSAIFVGGSGRLYINNATNADCDPDSLGALGAVQCSSAVTAMCNSYAYNDADTSVVAGTGSTIEVSGNGVFQANRLHFRKNTGDQFLYAEPDTGNVSLSNSVVSDNTYARLVWLDTASVSFDSDTFANNGLNTSLKAFSGSSAKLTLTNSIVDEPGVKTYQFSGASTPVISYVLSNDITTLPVSATVIGGDPQFVSSSTGDYHLMSNSPAIDFAPASPAGSSDLDEAPRTVDLPGSDSPGSGNNFGPRDLGAYEFQLGNVRDRIFMAGFDGS